MRNAQVEILNASDTGLAVLNSSAFDVGQAVSASFQPVMADTNAIGTLKLQVSNDLVANNNRKTFVPTNWTNIPSATSAISAGVGPMIVLGHMNSSYIRAVWTPTTQTLIYGITFSATPDGGQFRININGGNATMTWDNDAAGFQVIIRLITGCANATVSGSFAAGFTITIPDATSAVSGATLSNNTLVIGATPVIPTLVETVPVVKVLMNYLSI